MSNKELNIEQRRTYKITTNEVKNQVITNIGYGVKSYLELHFQNGTWYLKLQIRDRSGRFLDTKKIMLSKEEIDKLRLEKIYGRATKGA